MSAPSAPPSYNDVYDDKNKPAGAAYMPVNPGNAYGQPQPQPVYGQPPAQPGAGYPNSNYGAPYPASSAYGQPQPYGGGFDGIPKSDAPPTSGGYADASSDGEGFTVRGTFEDKNVRRLFIRKVFITLGLQLLVTFGIVCIFTFIPEVSTFVQANQGIYWAAYAVFLVVYIMLVCCSSVRRKHPTNIIFLMIFTLAFSYMVGMISTFYSTKSVVIALGVTVVVCGAVILFSMQTKFDFTKCGGLLFVLSMVLFLFGFITIFTYSRPWYIDVVYGALGALVFSLFLAFDTQLVMGGKRYELDPEEYIYGALVLYIDVIYIFLFLLQIFGGSSNN